MNTLVCRKRYFVYKNFRGERGSFEIIQNWSRGSIVKT